MHTVAYLMLRLIKISLFWELKYIYLSNTLLVITKMYLPYCLHHALDEERCGRLSTGSDILCRVDPALLQLDDGAYSSFWFSPLCQMDRCSYFSVHRRQGKRKQSFCVVSNICLFRLWFHISRGPRWISRNHSNFLPSKAYGN